MRLICSLIAAAAAFATNVALAHGPQIQITGESGKIVTRKLFIETPYVSLADPKSVYVMPLLDNIGVSYARPNNLQFTAPNVPTYFSGPGLAYGYGYDPVNNPAPFEVGSKFSFTFLDGLKQWNGSSFVDAGAAEFQAFTGGFAMPSGTATSGTAATLAVPAGAGSVAFTGDHPEDAHATVRYRYLGNGANPSSAPDGIYLLRLQVSSTQSGMLSSDPFYFVLNKGVGISTVYSALETLNISPELVQIIPEPGAMALTGIAAATMIGGVRRHRRRVN